MLQEMLNRPGLASGTPGPLFRALLRSTKRYDDLSSPAPAALGALHAAGAAWPVACVRRGPRRFYGRAELLPKADRNGRATGKCHCRLQLSVMQRDLLSI